MDYFYKHCVEHLFQPLQDLPEFKNMTGELLVGRFNINHLLTARKNQV